MIKTFFILNDLLLSTKEYEDLLQTLSQGQVRRKERRNILSAYVIYEAGTLKSRQLAQRRTHILF